MWCGTVRVWWNGLKICFNRQMKFQADKRKIRLTLDNCLRKAGYFQITDRISGQLSYVRRLSKIQHYPRFHLYIEESFEDYKFNLHLDQKRASYRGQVAHSADYDEPLVAEEAERIIFVISAKG